MTKTCKCCGQTLPDAYPLGVRLTAQQQLIANTVRRAGQHGIMSDDLVDAIYANSRDGGPLNAKGVIHVQIYLMNKKLKTVGKRITGAFAGPNPTFYTLQNIK